MHLTLKLVCSLKSHQKWSRWKREKKAEMCQILQELEFWNYQLINPNFCQRISVVSVKHSGGSFSASWLILHRLTEALR